MGGGVARAFPADIAMHVVLPEIDGRVFAGIASFKEAGTRDPALGFARTIHRADAGRIEAITARVAGWIALAQTPVAERRVALVLSTYPGKAYQIAHAVGLDALASAEAILADLAEAGYATDAQAGLAALLECTHQHWPLAEYRKALAALPDTLRAELFAAWGEPEADAAAADGAFRFAALPIGNALVALQPERGERAHRDGDYHDLSAARAMAMWRSTCGCASEAWTRWCMSAHMAHWNGCRANQSRCPMLAGPRR